MTSSLPVHEACVDRHHPEALALAEHGKHGAAYTFGELTEMSRRMATYLRHQEGVAPGDRVAIVLPQRLESALAHLACSRIGAVAVPLSPLFGADGLATRLGDADPKLVLTLEAHLPVLREALQQPRARDGTPVHAVDDAFFEVSWTAAREMDRADEARAGGDRPLWLVYTSGTTGSAKGALLPQRVIEGRMSGFRLGHEGGGDRFHSPADWSWIGGLMDSLFAPWHDAMAVVAHERHGHLDPAELCRLLQEHAVTDAFLPPTAMKLLARSGVAPPSLRTVHSAGEPLAVPTLRWARERLADRVTEVYGLTEAAYLVGTASSAYETPEGSMGRPFPGKEVVLDGEDGEICVRPGTPTMMLGYWRGPDAPPHLPLDAKGLLRTGDLAQEKDGFLHFLGRKDDLIKTSGYRIGPAEVEATLLHHPAVAECAVVGVPDPERGQRVKAYVVLAGGARADGAELARFVRERLGAHAYPREVELVETLPMTVSGKLRRRALRDAGR